MKDEIVEGGAYRRSGVEVVLSRGDWHNRRDAIHRLEKEGKGDNELTQTEVGGLLEDFRTLEKTGRTVFHGSYEGI